MGRDHKVKKMGLGWGHFQHLHVGREVPKKHHCGKIHPNPLQDLKMLECHA